MDQLISDITDCTSKGWCGPSDPEDPNNPEKMVYHVPKPMQLSKADAKAEAKGVDAKDVTVPANYAGPMPGSAECLPVHRVSGVGDDVGGSRCLYVNHTRKYTF